VNPWNEVDPKGPISCIPKPGGSTQVSLPGETPLQCTIRWKERAEAAEARVAELESGIKIAADALDEAADNIADWGAYASEYFQEKHHLMEDVASTKATAFNLRTLFALKR